MTPAPISVERFDHDIGRQLLDPATETYRQVSVMNPSDSGEYVLYDDYAEREAEVASLRTDVETLVKMKQHQEDRAEAAERAREGATGLLRRVNASLYLLDKPHREFGGVTDKTATDIAAFLAASGGAREA